MQEAGQYTFKRQLVWIGLNLLIELNMISCFKKNNLSIAKAIQALIRKTNL